MSLVTEESLQPVIWWRPVWYWEQRAAAYSSHQCLTNRQNEWGIWGLLCWHVPVWSCSTDLICGPHSVIYNRNLPIKTFILNTLGHGFVFIVWDLAWWRAFSSTEMFGNSSNTWILSENSGEIPNKSVVLLEQFEQRCSLSSLVIFVVLESNIWETLLKCR